jgi:hypothetical protein
MATMMESCANCGGAMEAAVVADDIPTADVGVVHAPAVPAERCIACGATFIGEAGFNVREAAVAEARIRHALASVPR